MNDLMQSIQDGEMLKRDMAVRAKQAEGSNEPFTLLWGVPLFSILAVTPLIVFLAVLPVPEVYRSFWTADINLDFFSYYKTRWFLSWSVPLLLSFIYYFIRGKERYLDFARKTKLYWALTLVFIISILLSTVFSNAPPISWWGMFDRYEGFWVWMAYCVLFAACAFLLRQDIHFRYVVGSIVISTTIIASIGVFQFFGIDIFMSDFGHFLILPEKYPSAVLNFTTGNNTIYATFFNPNYGGNIGAISLPPAICLCLLIRKIDTGAVLLFGYILLMFILAVGCRSRSGAFGILIASIFLIVYLARHERSKFIRLLIIFIILAIVYLGMDRFAGGTLTSRINDGFLQGTRFISISLDRLTYFYEFFTSHAGLICLLIALALLIIYLARRYHFQRYHIFLVIILPISIFFCQEFYVGGGHASADTHLSVDQRRQILMDSTNKSFFDNMIIECGSILSGRAYIYLRSMDERLKNHVLLGTGPDTFALYFPRNDEYRLFAEYPDDMLIDKMHSMYLQIWFNTGLISFISFLLLISIHFINTAQIFWKHRAESTTAILGLCFFLGWAGFLGAALFNDSAISVSPYFWAVFGASVAANYVIRNPELTAEPVWGMAEKGKGTRKKGKK